MFETNFSGLHKMWRAQNNLEGYSSWMLPRGYGPASNYKISLKSPRFIGQTFDSENCVSRKTTSFLPEVQTDEHTIPWKRSHICLE